MKQSTFKVKIYHSGYSTHIITAQTEKEAIKKARQLPPNKIEIFNSLENWEEADEITKL